MDNRGTYGVMSAHGDSREAKRPSGLAWVKKGGHYLIFFLIFQHNGAHMQENRADKTPNFGAACASIFKMILRKFSTKKMLHMRSF